jgi:crotonobetainyl-CoA:carnitine CoA-transferase CaiB-like acyl-CoA transferase
MQLAFEHGACDEAMRDTDWIGYGTRLVTGEVGGAHLAAAKAAVAALTSSHTKAELVVEARSRPLLLAPVVTVPELLRSEQLAARDYWEDIADPRYGPVRAPGRFAVFSGSPLPPLGRPPEPGEHTDAVLAGWADRPGGPRGAGGAGGAGGPSSSLGVPPAEAGDGRPLEGVRVVDFTWVYAGPLATRLLADFGATVVKVECARRSDATRGGGPFLEGDLGSDGSGQYAHFNAGKLGLALDLSGPEARSVAEDLVRWADVVVDSYTPGVMDAWGLGHERLLELNPQVIALSTCLMGQSGPQAQFSGFGNLAGAVTGFYELTGWPDRAPAGPFLAYTDYVSPRDLVAAVLAALAWRREHGRGQAIDLSQAECAIQFLAPALADWVVNGRAATRHGNADPWFAPHGVYPCAGEDRWVAIVCETEAQWAALCGALGAEAPLAELAGCDRAARLARAAELDDRLAAWTSARSAEEVEQRLISAGVPAHAVINSTGAAADPHLQAQGHFVTVAHPVHGTCVVEGPRVLLSRTPGRVTRAGPMLGEHTDVVLRDLLGYDDERIAELAVAGALD